MITFNELAKETKEELASHAIDGLGYCLDVYGCDLHHELFNVDYYIIGTYKAKTWLEDNVGVFEAIETIKEYEQMNFGEVNTDLSQPESVLNMFVYIMGEELLADVECLSEYWDATLNEGMIELIKSELGEI